MPEGLDFEELSSDHLFSLDLGTLCDLDDVCLKYFLFIVFVADNFKASCGLQQSDSADRSLYRRRGCRRGTFRE